MIKRFETDGTYMLKTLNYNECYRCKSDMGDAKFYYINGGALKECDGEITTNEFVPFMDIGIHDHDLMECQNDADGSWTESLEDGPLDHSQFELYFCSKSCMIEWFTEKVNKLKDRS